MAEQHQRCHLYPHCMIHTWHRLLVEVDQRERRTIIEEHAAGRPAGAIGIRHHLTTVQVKRIIAAQAVRPGVG